MVGRDSAFAALLLAVSTLACAGPHSNSETGPQASAPGQPAAEPEVHRISFDRLALPAYRAEPSLAGQPRSPKEELFNPEILDLDGQRVALEGYMFPIDWVPDSREVATFILSPYPPGCGGEDEDSGVYAPTMDAYVQATVESTAGVPWHAYRCIDVVGTFDVGEELDDYGYVISVYRLDVESVELH